MITEDTGVQGKGNWQFELNTDRAVERGSKLASQVVNAALTYGVTDTLDVAGNLPWQHVEVSSAPSDVEDGLGDTSLFLKWCFYEQGKLSFAVKPILYQPTGDKDRGLGSGRVSSAVVGIVTWGDDRTSFSGNLGYAYNNNSAGDHKDLWNASGSVIFPVSDKLSASFEVGAHRNSDPTNGKAPAFANFGLIYSQSGVMDVDIGYLRGLNDSEVLYSLGVGVTRRW